MPDFVVLPQDFLCLFEVFLDAAPMHRKREVVPDIPRSAGFVHTPAPARAVFPVALVHAPAGENFLKFRNVREEVVVGLAWWSRRCVDPLIFEWSLSCASSFSTISRASGRGSVGPMPMFFPVVRKPKDSYCSFLPIL